MLKRIRCLTPFVLVLAICGLSPASSVKSMPNGGWDAAWSPDGTHIAFTSGSPHSIPNLWVCNADGSGMRQLTLRGAHEPRWLPDGRTIVFGAIRTGQPRYMCIDASEETDSEKIVEALPPNAEDPVWSADGALVAYGVVDKVTGVRDLKFVRMAGGASEGLTSKFWVREWAWSPDGSALAVVVGRSVGTSLWIVAPKDKDIRLLYKGFCSAPAYSPDGKRLAIAIPDARSDFKILVINLETKMDKRIAVRTFDGRKIIWSPDGSRLYFSASTKSQPSIWSTGSNGKGLICLTPKDIGASNPSLSPDGSRIAFQAMDKDAYSPELYVSDSNGGSPSKTAAGTHSYWSPVWSPDGRKLAFQSDITHVHRLLTSTDSGRHVKAVAGIANPNPDPISWLADNKRILLPDAGKLLIVDTQASKISVQPIPLKGGMTMTPCVNGDRIYFAEMLSGTQAGISSVGMDGKNKSLLTNRPTPVEPTPEPEKNETPDGHRASAGTLVASTKLFVAQTPPEAKPPAKDETGNPHAGLGIIGPQQNLATPDTSAPVFDMSPAVSPDGKLLAFIRNGQLWLVESSGSGEKQLTQFQSEEDITHLVSDPCWSPAGDAILLPMRTSGKGKVALDLWLCSPEPGSQRMVYSETVDSEYGVYYKECTNPPFFTPDGKRIVFTSLSGGQPHIMSVALDGSDPRELAPAPSAFSAMNKAGSRLAYVDLTNSLERIRILNIESGKSTGPLFKR